jgi:hypothetical protein
MDLSRIPAPDAPAPGHASREAERRSVKGWQEVNDRWAELLIVAVAVWIVVPRVIQSLTASKHLANIGVDSPPLTGPAYLASSGLELAVIGLCVFIVFDVAKDAHPGPVGALALMLVPWVYLTARDMFTGLDPAKASYIYPLIAALLWLLRPRIEVLRYLGYVAGVSAVISIAIAVVLPSRGILLSSTGELVGQGKEIFSSGILIGFLTHGNTLGQFLALGLPFIGMVPRRWLRWALFAVTAFALIWTAARSILGAVLIGLLAVAISAALDPITRRWLMPVVAMVPFVIGGIVPFLVSNPHTFANRGLVWAVSFTWWHQSVLTGNGSLWYGRVGKTSDEVAASVGNGHNQLVHLLVTGGVVLAVIVFAQVIVAAVKVGEMAAAGRLVPVAYLGTLAGACVLEKAFAIVDNTPMLLVTVVPLTVLICSDLSSARRDGGTRPPPNRPSRHAGLAFSTHRQA